MPLKISDLLTRSWQSQANLSLFLFLLILVAFLLPSVGFEKNSLHFYDDAAASVVAVVGTAIAWRNRKLFLVTSVVVIVAIAFRWATWWRSTPTARLWSASTGLAAIIMITVVLLWQVFRSGPVTGMRVQGAIKLTCALRSDGRTHTTSRHWWIPTRLTPQEPTFRPRSIG